MKRSKGIVQLDKECDVVLIGHGSRTRMPMTHLFNTALIMPYYRNVEFCFLELDRPNIEEGIGRAVAGNPHILLIVPYFLHKGAHIKRDVIKDLNVALDKYNFKNVFMGQHLG